MKRCKECSQLKPLSEFYICRLRNGKEWLSSYCKPCTIERTTARAIQNPDKLKGYRRGGHLKKRFGLTLDEYDQLWASQGGVCIGCGDDNIAGRRLAVDHDHKTGEIRGLLCDRCNRALGSCKDSPAILRRLADYLESF